MASVSRKPGDSGKPRAGSRKKRQPYLPGLEGEGERKFGGSSLRGHARTARPISAKRALHLVMRSGLARGERSFLSPERARKIQALIHKAAYEQQIRLHRYANAGNHLHLIVQPKSRQGFQRFLKTISGLIARITLGAQRGKAQGLKFWDALPFTRILEWGRDYRTCCRYLLQNTLEAIGFVAYRPRGRRAVSTGSPRARGREGPIAGREGPT